MKALFLQLRVAKSAPCPRGWFGRLRTTLISIPSLGATFSFFFLFSNIIYSFIYHYDMAHSSWTIEEHIQKGPCQPINHDFSKTQFGKTWHHFKIWGNHATISKYEDLSRTIEQINFRCDKIYCKLYLYVLNNN
jgi:hypothetical protein